MQKHEFWNREFVAALATTIFGRMGAGVMRPDWRWRR